MSSQREVLIRILALFQRKTLVETKNLTLKCLKRHNSTVKSMKNVAVLTEDGAFSLFFRPHQGGSVAEWSARRTSNPAVPGSSPALATCWICARSSRVQILGHACK